MIYINYSFIASIANDYNMDSYEVLKIWKDSSDTENFYNRLEYFKARNKE